MKLLVSIAALLFCTTVNSQVISNKIKTPVYFLDSVKVDYAKLYLNPLNIKAINVVKNDSIRNPGGAVFISIVRGTSLVSLSKLVAMSSAKSAPYTYNGGHVYLIDGKVVSDTLDVRVDTSIIKSVQYSALRGIKYLKEPAPDIQLVMIETGGRSKNQGNIRIR